MKTVWLAVVLNIGLGACAATSTHLQSPVDLAKHRWFADHPRRADLLCRGCVEIPVVHADTPLRPVAFVVLPGSYEQALLAHFGTKTLKEVGFREIPLGRMESAVMRTISETLLKCHRDATRERIPGVPLCFAD